MKLPEKWTKLELEAFHTNDAVSVAIKLHQLIDYLAERDCHRIGGHLKDGCCCHTKSCDMDKFHSETPLFKAEDMEDSQVYETEDGTWMLQAVYYKEFKTEGQAREALLKLTQ